MCRGPKSSIKVVSPQNGQKLVNWMETQIPQRISGMGRDRWVRQSNHSFFHLAMSQESVQFYLLGPKQRRLGCIWGSSCLSVDAVAERVQSFFKLDDPVFPLQKLVQNRSLAVNPCLYVTVFSTSNSELIDFWVSVHRGTDMITQEERVEVQWRSNSDDCPHGFFPVVFHHFCVLAGLAQVTISPDPREEKNAFYPNLVGKFMVDQSSHLSDRYNRRLTINSMIKAAKEARKELVRPEDSLAALVNVLKAASSEDVGFSFLCVQFFWVLLSRHIIQYSDYVSSESLCALRAREDQLPCARNLWKQIDAFVSN